MKCFFLALLLVGCQSAPPSPPKAAPSNPAPVSPAASNSPSPAAPSASVPASSTLAAPLSGPPRLVVENHSTVDIDIYGAYLVDERGEQGTMKLWPHRNDCPKYEPKKHIVPMGGTIDMPPPTRSYDSEKCEPGPPLPPGRYVLRLDSGRGEELYASTVFSLPLAAPVRLAITNHADEPWACDSTKAQRAARLVFADVKTLPGNVPNLLDGCDIARAQCGTLPLEEVPPPSVCTVTLHENLIRVHRAPGNDAIREITSWTDRVVSYAREPDVGLTSASKVQIGGQSVVFEGQKADHRHMHGGDAASIGDMSVRVHNPLDRALRYSVDSVEWLTDHDCALPSKIVRRPAVQGASPPSLPPGESELEISFESQGAYMAHCDRFASRARMHVEGKPLTVTVEHHVMRYEPMRR